MQAAMFLISTYVLELRSDLVNVVMNYNLFKRNNYKIVIN